MKLTIFGATGRTGRLLVALALEAGHDVTAYARTPSKLQPSQKHLTCVEGDIRNAERVAMAVEGADVVLSVLGPTDNEPTFIVSTGVAHILSAMRMHGVRRLIQTVGAGVGDPLDRPGLIDKVITAVLKRVSRNVYEDMAHASAAIRASGLDWTLVRVPRLTDAPATDSPRVAYLGAGVGTRVSRATVAAFVLKQVDDNSYVRQAPVISD